MRKINKIILHCSDSAWGSAAAIDRWHVERGMRRIGYHYVILNGVRHSSGEYRAEDDETYRALLMLKAKINVSGAAMADLYRFLLLFFKGRRRYRHRFE